MLSPFPLTLPTGNRKIELARETRENCRLPHYANANGSECGGLEGHSTSGSGLGLVEGVHDGSMTDAWEAKIFFRFFFFWT